MKRILFDYSVSPEQVAKDRENKRLTDLILKEFASISFGRIFIIFEPQRHCLVLESSVIDNTQHLLDALRILKTGPHEVVVTSADYESVNLHLKYDPRTGLLDIVDINCEDYKVQTNFKLFSKELNSFASRLKNDMLLTYPGLISNIAFSKESLGRV